MKKTIKEKLVDYMLENGNDFTYTDMIKKVLKIVKGSDHEYNYNSADRGFYATNFCLRWNGYMVNGKGTCGVFKNPSGLWSARYYKNNKNKYYDSTYNFIISRMGIFDLSQYRDFDH